MLSPEPTAGARKTAARSWLAVAALTAAALALRLAGIGFMLPHTPNVDEQVLSIQVARERHIESLAEKATLPLAYPTLIAKTVGAVTPNRTPVSRVRAQASDVEPRTLEEHLAAASAGIVEIRTWIAILSALAVPLTFLLARKFLSDTGALLASALIAVSVLHEWYSSQARPHGALCTLTLASVLASIELCRRGRTRDLVVAGIAAALAVCCLQSGAFVLPALAVAIVVGERRSARKWLAWTVPAGIVALGIAAFYRFGASPLEDALGGAGFFDRILSRTHGIALEDFRGRGFFPIAKALWSYDPLISVLALAGGTTLLARGWSRRITLASRRTKDAAVVLAHAVPHVVAFGLFERTFQRFLMPIVPYLCILAAFALLALGAALASRLRSSTISRASRTLAILPVLLILGVQSWAAVRVARLKCAPDTEELAAAWIREHVARGEERIAIGPSLELPLLRTPETISETLVHDRLAYVPWVEYEVALAPSECARLGYSIVDLPLRKNADRERFQGDPKAFVLGLGARWAVVEVQHVGRRPILRDLRDTVRSLGTRVAHFVPRSEDEDDLPITYEFDGPWAPEQEFAWRAARFDRQGPEIEIYELAR
jgi:hypothetical protein